ncbi:MAG: hypothetical protein H7A20_08385 [Rhodanobacteraceae bacterium]|nr:hypothetical protein [Xanthomonadales bacterium]MCP5478784.1 hypothetical protein [Rhodanobacteraceae bacterium]HPF73790.1 hypothetical protein [Xanthomonadaceae bacterium]HRY00200.1 hypothetical protein [Xanthomonadaceae bacterium]
MSRTLALLTSSALCFCAFTGMARATVCGGDAGRAPLPLREGLLVPVSPALASGPAALDFQGSPLGIAGDENLSVDRVLQRLRQKNCVVDEFAGYVPKTQFDNTPYRFSMDSSKKFTADEFDAWMKKRGVRIAKGGGAKDEADAATDAPASADTAAASDASAKPAMAAGVVEE